MGLARALVEVVINQLRGLPRYALDRDEILDARPAHGLGGAEVAQQRALPGRADAADLVERVLRHVDLAAGAVRADGEAVGLVAKPLDEVENRIARLQHEGLAAGPVEGL